MDASLTQSGGYSQTSWRTPLLSMTLRVTAILDSLWFGIILIKAPEQVFMPRRLVGMALLALVWFAAIFKRLPETFRVAALLAGYFGFSTLNIIDNGPVALGALLPLVLFLLIAMLYGGLRGAFIAGGAILVLYAIGAFGWITGVFPLSSIAVVNDPHDVSLWIRTVAGQLLVSGAIVAIVFYVTAHGQRALTAQLLAERALRDSEDRARLLIEHAPEAIVVLDVESRRFVVVNPAAEALFGYSQTELLTKSPVDVSPERQPDGRLSSDAAANYVMTAVQGTPITFEWLHRDSQGREILCEVRLLRLPDPERVLVRGSVLDVTERKQMESALKESMALLRATLSAAPVGIARVHNRILLEVSDTFARMMGYRREELIGQETRVLYFSDEEHQSASRAYLSLDQQDAAMGETHLMTKDRRILDVAFNAVWLDASHRDAGVVFAFIDITERNQLQNQLRRSQKLEAIGTLAGGIAHDFNNILTAILGFTALAESMVEDDAALRNCLSHIGRAAQRAAELVTQILTFSRSSSPTQVPLQLREVADEVVKLLRATLPSTIELKLQLPTQLPTVLGNASQLHQVVMNLGTNAAQAMRGQSGTLSITLSARDIDESQARLLDIPAGSYVCLNVTDTGSGMDAITLERAFEPFFTTKTKGEGTGLGLAVVHGIIRSHHGAIRLSSQVGRGTSAEIFLPVCAAEAVLTDGIADTVLRGDGEHILFVDDEEQLVLLGVQMLRNLGYQVEGESDVLRALARIENDPGHFNLVVTDQTMPGLTGIEFAAHIHAIRPELPVVLTSGYSSALTTEQLQKSSVRELLSKPYSVGDLATVIRRHLHATKEQVLA